VKVCGAERTDARSIETMRVRLLKMNKKVAPCPLGEVRHFSVETN